jgi:phenylalanine-4-hydroxylase
MRNKPIEQIYENYTPEDFAVWKRLFQRQMNNLREHACGHYLEALDIIGFNEDKIPDFKEVNAVLMPRTGWRLVVAKGGPNEIFFTLGRKSLSGDVLAS